MIPILVIALLLVTPSASAQQAPPDGELLGRTVSLPLQRAVELTLQNNLDLQVARTGPAVAVELVGEAQGAFDPLGFAGWDFAHDEIPTSSPIFGLIPGFTETVIDEDNWLYAAGVAGITPPGLTYELGYNTTRRDSNSPQTALDPEWRATAGGELTVPLLKDLVYNEVNVTVKRSHIAEDITEEEFRTFLISLLFQLEQAYWDLAAADAEVRVTKKSLKTVQDLLEQTRVRYEVGVVSRVLVTQAEAGVAEREVIAIVAENRAGTAHDLLLNLVAAPDATAFTNTTLVPDVPTYVEYEVNDDASIARAMRHRPELAAARRQIEDSELLLTFARNQRLPRLDLKAGYRMDGLSGSAKPGVPISPSIQSGSSSANDDFFKGSGQRSWSFGARFEIPIGNHTARHRVIQREIERRRSRTDLRRIEQRVILEVRKAARNIRSAIEALEASERRRVAQEETLRAEEERLRLGDSTPFVVLEHEQDLVEAELQEIVSFQTYRNAIAGLEASQGTLLEARKVSVAEELHR
jgi:outer membrane protein TolC